MSDDPAVDPEADDIPYRFGVLDLIIAIVVGFLFVYSAYVAVGNLAGVPGLVASLKVGSVPWPSLVAAVVVPPVAFVGAIVLGRGRPSFDRALLLVASVAATSALELTLLFVSLSSLRLI